MKILTIIRQGGQKMTIEMPDDYNLQEVLKENEIEKFESATVKTIKKYKQNEK
ncbi:MAG: hypothetical protein ACOH1X_02790 [Kaistella sp.]